MQTAVRSFVINKLQTAVIGKWKIRIYEKKKKNEKFFSPTSF